MSDDHSNKRASQSYHRHTLSVQKTKVCINVYDLLQPGKLSTFLWHVGSALLHSGVVVGDKEYAYGGHEEKGVSGVYWNRPALEPPGCTFRAEVLHGFTVLDAKEIDNVVREASHLFQGTEWNLLTRNCNHFTSYLCEQLTGQPAPPWLNRAASIGISMPCIIPTEFLRVPDAETVDGELVEDPDDDNERTAILHGGDRRRRRADGESWLDSDPDDDDDDNESDEDGDLRPSLNAHRRSDSLARAGRNSTGARHVAMTDSSGRVLPERHHPGARARARLRERCRFHLGPPHDDCTWEQYLVARRARRWARAHTETDGTNLA